MDTIAGIEQFPILSSMPTGVPYDPTQLQKTWAPTTPVPGAGKVAYPYLAADGTIAFGSIPTAQYNIPNIQPVGYVPPPGVTVASGAVPPPIDLTKYNSLASEGEQIVATPFGPMIEQAEPAPPATASASEQNRILAGIQELLTRDGLPAV